IISSMLAAVAWKKPMPRTSCGSVESGKVIGYDRTVLRIATALALLASLALGQTELQQALTLARAGRFAEARDMMKGVAAPRAIPQQVAYHRLKAAIASGLHENGTAAAEMEAALALSPGDGSLLLATAVSEDQAGNDKKAIDILSKAGSNADAKSLLGDILQKQGDAAESVNAYREAIHLDPQREAFRMALGRELVALGAFDQANVALQESLSSFPKSAPLLTLFGILQYSGGQVDGAKQALLRAISADSGYGPAYLSLARIALESANTPGAEESAALCRWDKITCSALRLRSARDNNDKELERRSIAVLQAAPPGNATAACALGQAYTWNDRPQEARLSLETCVKLKPTPQNHYRLAQVYRKLGEGALAREQLEARSKLLKLLSDQTGRAADSLKVLEPQIKD
ncbi:MAG: tetratricopeptide repeat protein, partial [Bryobacteraceae bacterium]